MRGKKSTLRAKLKSAQKKDFWSWKNISRICLEILLKSQTNVFKNYWCTTRHQTRTVYKGRAQYSIKNFFKNLNASPKYSLKFEWQENFDCILFVLCNAVYKQNRKEKWIKGCILPFFKKGSHEITKNYRVITLTAIAAKVYNALLIYCIQSESKKIVRKNQNSIWRNHSTTSQTLTVQLSKQYKQRILRQHSFL